MSASIFTTQTPSVTNASDASPGLTLGTLFQSDIDGAISGIRWYYPATLPGAAVIGLLYAYTNEATGTELARATFASPTAGTWNTVTFSSPVAITAGTKYVAAVFTVDRYVATSGLFASSGITNGHLTALANDDLTATNGKFNQSAAAHYPDGHFGASCYFVDVLFDLNSSTNAPAGAATATGVANDATAAVAAGAAVATGSGAAHPVTAAVGATSPTASGTGTAYSATVALGANVSAASGTGTAHAVTAAIRAQAGCATGTGAAYGVLATSRDIDFIITGAPEIAWRTAPPSIAWAAGIPEM